VIGLLIVIGLSQIGQPLPRFERLDNGLRIVILEDHTLPLASVQLCYAVGSACDPPGKPGLCSVARALLEHRDDAALRLRAAGIRFDSRTLRDACCFASVLPPNLLQYALEIEATRMEPVSVTAEAVTRALHAAALRSAEQVERSDHQVMRHVLGVMFPEHPYRHPPEFTAESLEKLTPTEIDAFLQRWFVSGNATLLVIGDVSTVQVLEQVRRRFGKLEWTEPPRRAQPQPPANETIRSCAALPRREGIAIAWLTSPLGYFQNAALDVLMEHLCNPIDGPLCRALEQIGAASPHWSRHAWRDAGILLLSVDGRAVTPQAIERAVLAELTAAAERVPDELAHNRARALAEQRAWLRRAALPQRAALLAAYQMVAGDILLAQFDAAGARGVGVGDLQAAAAALSSTRRVVVDFRSAVRSPSSPRADPLTPALAADRQKAADIDHLLARVAAINATTPPIVQPLNTPAVTVSSTGRAVVKCCRLATLEQTVALSIRHAGGGRRRSLLSAPTIRDKPPGGPLWDRWRDYASYHGILYRMPDTGDAAGIPCWLEPERLAASLEWQARLLQAPWLGQEAHAGARNQIEIIVVGDVERNTLQRWSREFWSDWNPPTSEASSSPATRPISSGALKVRWQQSHQAGISIQLTIDLPAGQPPDYRDDLEVDALSVLLGRVPFHRAAWTDELFPEWRSWITEERQLAAQVSATDETFANIIQRIWKRLQRVRAGTIPQDQLSAALKLARAERLISLDSGAAVADALWRGRANPWNTHAQVGPRRLAASVSAAIQSASVTITVYSADAALATAVRALADELNAVSRQEIPAAEP